MTPETLNRIKGDCRMGSEYNRRNLIQAGSYGACAGIETMITRLNKNKSSPKWMLEYAAEIKNRLIKIPPEMTAWRNEAPDNPYRKQNT